MFDKLTIVFSKYFESEEDKHSKIKSVVARRRSSNNSSGRRGSANSTDLSVSSSLSTTTAGNKESNSNNDSSNNNNSNNDGAHGENIHDGNVSEGTRSHTSSYDQISSHGTSDGIPTVSTTTTLRAHSTDLHNEIGGATADYSEGIDTAMVEDGPMDSISSGLAVIPRDAMFAVDDMDDVYMEVSISKLQSEIQEVDLALEHIFDMPAINGM